MKIKNAPLDFFRLNNDVLQDCPHDQSVAFIEGYTDFTNSFFESVISLSKIFYDLKEKTCDIDFNFSSMEANEQITRNETKFAKEMEDYRGGALLAEHNSLQAFLILYKLNSGSKAT